MSNPDSFIEEVTEEVRRDRLFLLMRRYGWIAVAVVVILVGGAAWNEWRKAREAAAAQALGDAMLAALDAPDPAARRAALDALDSAGATGAVTTLLAAGNAEGAEADMAAALRAITADASLPTIYRDLAAMKLTLLDGAGLSPEDRIALLEPLTAPGRAFRLLALEQTALANVSLGNPEAAIAIARDIMVDSEVTQDLRRRLSQLIVALGGTLDAS